MAFRQPDLREDRDELASESTRRRSLGIVALPGERHSPDELAVFNIIVNGAGEIGRWVCTKDRAWVTWTDGRELDTEPCENDKQVIAAVRQSVPLPPAAPSEAAPPPRFFASTRAPRRPRS